jgi:uncharacterized protein YbjQ (UPF0145 family)
MQVSFTGALEGGRATKVIGRIKAVGKWRCAEEATSEAERGADALIDVRFEADETADNEGVALRRLVATGSAVRVAQAA